MRTGFETVSVPDAISSIIREYSLGTGLFREIIQNAEDAGAAVLVRISYPLHLHNTIDILIPEHSILY